MHCRCDHRCPSSWPPARQTSPGPDSSRKDGLQMHCSWCNFTTFTRPRKDREPVFAGGRVFPPGCTRAVTARRAVARPRVRHLPRRTGDADAHWELRDVQQELVQRRSARFRPGKAGAGWAGDEAPACGIPVIPRTLHGRGSSGCKRGVSTAPSATAPRQNSRRPADDSGRHVLAPAAAGGRPDDERVTRRSGTGAEPRQLCIESHRMGFLRPSAGMAPAAVFIGATTTRPRRNSHRWTCNATRRHSIQRCR
jgi:hypothetical protein